MFGRGEKRRRRSGFGIARLFLSLMMMSILGFGVYLAYRSFSGYDPLKADPKSIVKSLLSSDSAYKFITNLLSFSPTKSLSLNGSSKDPGGSAGNTQPTADLKFKFAVIGDSHRDWDNLRKALNQAKDQGAKLIIGLGDFSDVGTIDELTNTKKEFDAVGLPYYVSAGDHDLWDSRNQKKAAEENFRQVFGTPYQSFAFSGARFLIFYDSDNYIGLDTLQLKWIEDEISRVKAENPTPFFVFSSTPLYHPSSDHVMGKLNPKLKDQADHLLSIFSKVAVSEGFFADTHFYSRYTDPTTNLKITTIGAVTSDRNPQTPRFAMVDVFVDGSYNVEETEVKH